MNTKIEQKIAQAPELDFGTIFSNCIELFKKVWLQGLITLVLTLALMLPFYFIIYTPLIAVDIIDPDAFKNSIDSNPILLIPFVLVFIVFMIFAAAISLAMQAAFYRICKQKDLNENTKDDYFYYFKKPYLLKLITLALVTVIISVLCTMLCVLPLIYAIVPVSFFVVVFAFNPEMTVSDIVKTSFKIGNKKWLITFGLILVCGVLAQIVGLLMCFVGVFLTSSFSYLPIYFIYKHVVGFNDEESVNDIKELEL
ncbi:hypothetical protein [Formosa sp. A9]|uniref:hypothetical protein n=1 Tax=Formosa sp. A9 TaxID=3442641 RepID=UPI003EBDDA3E